MKKYVFYALSVLLLAGCNVKTNEMKENQTLNTIMTRVSVRQFSDAKPTAGQIDTLLRAAMAAPSAVNKQPWAFLVVDDKEMLQKIGEQFPNSRVQNGAQVAIVPCGDLGKALEGEAQDYWIQDVSAAVENLLLAAHSMGLGAVWTGLTPIKARADAAAELLGLPEGIVPLCIIPVGYPAETPAVKDKYKAENVHYNVW
ncbi:MAG: nitroreductase family protein [Paludibacteraceae bacterium]|nr:nitroreductase family protein [Paludibacteraceae bacterium]